MTFTKSEIDAIIASGPSKKKEEENKQEKSPLAKVIQSLPSQNKEKKESSGFFDSAKDFAQTLTDESINFAKGVPPAILQGIVGIGRSMGPLPPENIEEMRKQQAFDEAINDPFNVSDTFGGSAGIRFGKAVPGLALGGFTPGQIALRGGTGSLIGQGLQEGGFGETAQAIGEILPTLVPTGKFTPRQNEREVYDFLKRQGLNDEEALLAIRKGGYESQLGKFSPSSGRVGERVSKTRQALGRVWDGLENSKAAQQTPQGQDISKFINNVTKKITKNFGVEKRSKITEDLRELIGTQMSGADLINFHKKINEIDPHAFGILKNDVIDLLYKIDPSLAMDFQLQNQAWGRFSNNLQKLNPKLIDRMISAGEATGATTGIAKGLLTGDFSPFNAVLGVVGGRQLAAEIVSNPKLHNLVGRTIDAVSRGSFNTANKLKNRLVIELAEINPEAAKDLENFTFSDLEK